MQINEINNLLELFYYQYQKQNKDKVFLEFLKEPVKKYTWNDTYLNIIKLSKEISKYINEGDRCLLVSENRPEWMISDLSIMLSKGITVPAYTTYTNKDYEYIIDDCLPSIIFVSNKIQYEKIKDIIPKKNFIKKVIFFDDVTNLDKNFNINISEIFNSTKETNKNILDLKILRKAIACIIYKSGTQGNPKGVVFSHGGILNNGKGAYNL